MQQKQNIRTKNVFFERTRGGASAPINTDLPAADDLHVLPQPRAPEQVVDQHEPFHQGSSYRVGKLGRGGARATLRALRGTRRKGKDYKVSVVPGTWYTVTIAGLGAG